MSLVHASFGPDHLIFCPCRKCMNLKRKHQNVVEYDIVLNGISRAYTKWIHHGEAIDVDVLEGLGDDHVDDAANFVDVSVDDTSDDGN